MTGVCAAMETVMSLYIASYVLSRFRSEKLAYEVLTVKLPKIVVSSCASNGMATFDELIYVFILVEIYHFTLLFMHFVDNKFDMYVHH